MIEEPPEPPLSQRGIDKGRTEVFSDGVFAIAITLLILGVHVPVESHALIHDVIREWPAFLGYGISFLTILIMWINHHRLVDQLARVNNAFLLLNGLLLMAITFVNYSTSLLADYLTTSEARPALLIFTGTFVVVAICFNLLWLYATRGKRLLGLQSEPQVVAAITHAYHVGLSCYVVALLVALVSWQASLAIDGLLVVYFAILGMRTG